MIINRYFAETLITGPGIPRTAANDTTIHNTLMVVFTILGALSFLLMVIAGFRYVLSAGDPQKMAVARNMILYTAIGLVLSLSAAAIVNYVLNSA